MSREARKLAAALAEAIEDTPRPPPDAEPPFGLTADGAQPVQHVDMLPAIRAGFLVLIRRETAERILAVLQEAAR